MLQIIIVDDRHLLPVGYLCHACLFGCASKYNVGVAVNLSRNHDFRDLWWRRGVNRRRCSQRGTIGAGPNEILNARDSFYVPPTDADKLTLNPLDRHLLPVGHLSHARLFGCPSKYNLGVAVNLSRNHDFPDLWWRRGVGVHVGVAVNFNDFLDLDLWWRRRRLKLWRRRRRGRVNRRRLSQRGTIGACSRSRGRW